MAKSAASPAAAPGTLFPLATYSRNSRSFTLFNEGSIDGISRGFTEFDDLLWNVETLETKTLLVASGGINGQQSQVSKDIIRLPFGLLGFEGVKNYALVANSKEGGLLWLQMLEGAKHSFLVTPPCLIQPDYGPVVNEQDVKFWGLTGGSRRDSAQHH